ncbi:MAG: hypothetical protein CFH01_00120 [Alphaproteobacteria bacterium MarineAlpha2_Bin1]|nr:MAG: hypothetical protein CFH01_00120 [Alphaproteobacteria bacterium MarineAlpha2_Bin1]
MTAILWGLLGALLIGTSDTIARITSQRISITLLILFIMSLSSILMSLWFLITWNWPSWDLYSWSASVISGFLNLIAVAFLYKALARGPVYVASPATASYSVILIVINITIGELFTLTQLLASIIVFFGIVMISAQPKKIIDKKYSSSWLRVTALLGLGAGFTIALRFFFAQESIEFLGAEHALYLNRLSAFIFILIFFIVKNFKNKYEWFPKNSTMIFVTLQAILETLALAAFLYGSMNGGRIGATIGFSTFAIVTSVVSWIWLGEKIPTNKFLWIIIITFAIIFSIAYAPN